MEPIIQFLYDFLFTSPLPGPVNMALAPLVAAGIGIGSQVLGQVLGRGIGALTGAPERRRASRRADRAQSLKEQQFEALQEQIGDVEAQSALARQLAEQSVSDVFGAERQRRIQQATDRLTQQGASAQNAIARALLAGGGDVTGSGGITLNRLTEATQANLGNTIAGIENEIAQRFDQRQRFQQSRADNLLATTLGADAGLFGQLSGQASSAERLRLLQRQAQNQLGSDIGSTGASLAAALIENPPPKTNTITPDG